MGNTPEIEKGAQVSEESIKTKNQQQTEILIEPSQFPTLKAFLANEFATSNIVYQRIYPTSLPIPDRKSLFFTELYNIKQLLQYKKMSCANEMDYQLNPFFSRLLTDSELIPFYSLKNPADSTLIFESRFESGNLRMAIKVELLYNSSCRNLMLNMIFTCKMM